MTRTGSILSNFDHAVGDRPIGCARAHGDQTDRTPWTLRVGFHSDTGYYRDDNEDCCYANRREGLFIVADGVGGYAGGEIASQILIDALASRLIPELQKVQKIDNENGRDEFEHSIREAIQAAQREMARVATSESKLGNMGSTLVLGVVFGESLLLTHLGDSRAYLVRHNKLHQLTTDHTLVQALVDAGCLSAEHARRHPLRHVISEQVTAKQPCSEVSIQEIPLMAGDRLLFATDGLTDVVDEEWIECTLAAEEDVQTAADVLVGQALWNDSKDNISCVVVHVETPRP